MATFSNKKTGTNMTSWEYYVENKDDWKRFEDVLKIEDKTKTPSILYKDPKGKSAIGKPLKNGQKIKLLSNKSFLIDKKIHANISALGSKGYFPISKIAKPSRDTTKDENIALAQLDGAIKERALKSKEGICIIIKDEHNKVAHTFYNCTGAKTIKGTPKADFSINTSHGPEVFISHKKAGGPSAFQQYVSITGRARDDINQHPFVKKTLEKFYMKFEDVVKRKARYKIRIPFTSDGKRLIMMAIYGLDYGKKYGSEHVHLIGQGQPVLGEASPKDRPKGCGTVYELTFSDGQSLSGELTHFKKKGFVPILWLRFAAGRKIYVQGIELVGARAFISPEAHGGGSAKELK